MGSGGPETPHNCIRNEILSEETPGSPEQGHKNVLEFEEQDSTASGQKCLQKKSAVRVDSGLSIRNYHSTEDDYLPGQDLC